MVRRSKLQGKQHFLTQLDPTEEQIPRYTDNKIDASISSNLFIQGISHQDQPIDGSSVCKYKLVTSGTSPRCLLSLTGSNIVIWSNYKPHYPLQIQFLRVCYQKICRILEPFISVRRAISAISQLYEELSFTQPCTKRDTNNLR